MGSRRACVVLVLIAAWTCPGPTAPFAQTPQAPPCQNPVLAPFATLAGTWDVAVASRLSGNPTDWDTTTAVSTIERAMRDCAWIERYEGRRRATPFEVVRVYGSAPGHRGLSVVAADSEHGALYLSTGAADSTGMVSFYTQVTTPAGEVRLRFRLLAIGADGFTTENHRSPDGGATWDLTGRAVYRRRAPR